MWKEMWEKWADWRMVLAFLFGAMLAELVFQIGKAIGLSDPVALAGIVIVGIIMWFILEKIDD